jgi:hypothetical protein
MKKIGIIILIVAVIGIAVYMFIKSKKKKNNDQNTNTGPLEARMNLEDASGNKAGMSLLEDPLTGESAWVVDNKQGTDGRLNATPIDPATINTTGADGRVTMNSIPRNSNPSPVAPVAPIAPLQTAQITPKAGFVVPKIMPKPSSIPGKMTLPRKK